MTDLSPAAAAVMNAYYCDAPLTGRERVAAALRAAADQVVPLRRKPLYADNTEESAWSADQDTREELLAIATELKDLKWTKIHFGN